LKIVESLETPHEEALRNLDRALDLLHDLQSAYIAATDSQRRLFNQAIFYRIWIDREDVSGSSLAEPFDDLLDEALVSGEWSERTKQAEPAVQAAMALEGIFAELSLVGATDDGRTGPENARIPAEASFRGDSHVETMVRMRGLEPPRSYLHTDLNRARLPIPPHPPTAADDIARAPPGGTRRPAESSDARGVARGADATGKSSPIAAAPPSAGSRGGDRRTGVC
jgi:hypothetical protein